MNVEVYLLFSCDQSSNKQETKKWEWACLINLRIPLSLVVVACFLEVSYKSGKLCLRSLLSPEWLWWAHIFSCQDSRAVKGTRLNGWLPSEKRAFEIQFEFPPLTEVIPTGFILIDNLLESILPLIINVYNWVGLFSSMAWMCLITWYKSYAMYISLSWSNKGLMKRAAFF